MKNHNSRNLGRIMHQGENLVPGYKVYIWSLVTGFKKHDVLLYK